MKIMFCTNQKIQYLNMNNKIPILSFYSGGGFMDMGFEQAGFDIVWTNEFDESFAKLHAAGITSWRKSKGINVEAEIFNTKSIVDISSKEIIGEAFPNGKPKYFGIIGGPPCQDFSINGKLKGFKGDRGKLTILFLKKIYELKPSFFVMENVTGLMKVKSNKLFLEKLLKKLKSKYIFDYKILNSLEYGVPQNRERVFIVGFKKDLNFIESFNEDFFRFDWPKNEKYMNIQKKINWPKTNNYGEDVNMPVEVPIELCVNSCLVSKDKMDVIKNANEFFPFRVDEEKLNNIQEGETNRPSFKRLHRFRYSPTACYGNNEVHLHPYENRRISVREALRIQGVSDNYELPEEIKLTKKFKMIGNGVPVPLAEAVAVSILDFIKKYIILKID